MMRAAAFVWQSQSRDLSRIDWPLCRELTSRRATFEI
jgi:hypothetical protein